MIGLGNSRFTNKEFSREEWYLEALNILGKEGEISLRAQALIALGNSRFTNKEFSSNSEWYLEALNILGNGGDCNLEAQALTGLGNYYAGNRKNEEACQCLEDVLKMRFVRGDLIRTAEKRLGQIQRYLQIGSGSCSRSKKGKH